MKLIKRIHTGFESQNMGRFVRIGIICTICEFLHTVID